MVFSNDISVNGVMQLFHLVVFFSGEIIPSQASSIYLPCLECKLGQLTFFMTVTNFQDLFPNLRKIQFKVQNDFKVVIQILRYIN